MCVCTLVGAGAARVSQWRPEDNVHGVSSSLPPLYGFQGLNPGHGLVWQSPLPSELACWPFLPACILRNSLSLKLGLADFSILTGQWSLIILLSKCLQCQGYRHSPPHPDIYMGSWDELRTPCLFFKHFYQRSHHSCRPASRSFPP